MTSMENVEDIYPLSPLQQGLLFHTLNAPDSGVYFQQYCCVLRGPLDPPRFQEAWRQTVARHPVLRSAFVWEGLDEPVQVVRGAAEPEWEERDWQDLSAEDRRRELADFLAADRRRGFAPSEAPLMRFALMRLGPQSHRLVWSYHHLLSDGWSTALVVREVGAAYRALRRGNRPDRPPARPYRDYIAWLQQQDTQAAAAFWRERLAGFDAPTPLGLDRVRAAADEAEHGRREIELTAEKTQVLTAFARAQRLTLNTLVQGAWARTLNRYSGETDLVFGVTVSGRPADLAGVEDMVGPFINTLPLRVRLDPQAQVGPWLGALQEQLVQMRQYEYSSLVEIQGQSDVPRGRPLFESIVVFENYPDAPSQGTDADEVALEEVDYLERSNYPLAILVLPGATLRLIAIYDEARLDAAAAERLLGHMATALESLVADPSGRLERVQILDTAQRHRLLVEWNQTRADLPSVPCWHVLFEAQARQHPERPAVVCGPRQLDYGRLNEAANRLALHLRGLGVGPEVLVGLCAERSIEAVVGLLGVLKAGGAYMPLDPAYPQERLQQMAADAPMAVLLTQEKHRERLADYSGPTVVLEEPLGGDGHDPPCQTRPEHLAYVIHTSGSTGRPRGVAVSQANLLASTWARTHFYARPVRRFLLLSSLSFDSSVAGLFWTLCQGGALHLPEAESAADVDYLGRLIETQGISHLLCVPSLYQYLLSRTPERLNALETAIVAGEPCPQALVETHFRHLPSTELFNEYGPSEATVWCTASACRAGKPVAIGRPVANTRVYVLGPDRQPVPLGVAGELYVGGAGVARGYLGREGLSEEGFVADPFASDPSSRLYRTGDWVRYREDGELEFVGRRDDQVKILGHRIELGEIEAVLGQHPAVEGAVALALGGKPAAEEQGLLRRLLALGPREAEALLAEVEAEAPPAEVEADEEPSSTGTEHGVRRDDFELLLRPASDGFVAPPRPEQRRWLLVQAMNEFAADLEHLDAVAGRFVPGAGSRLDEFDISQSRLDDQQIMEDWQTPLMRAMAAQVAAPGADILEIGFGRGVSARFIQELGVASHTVIESNPHSVKDHFEPWRRRHPERDIRLIPGRWQEAEGQMGLYDGIFFHAFPLNEEEYAEYVLNSVTFAEHFFPTAAAHLKPGGAFTYLSTEVDSLSRRHQRLLFRHFTSISLSVEALSVPADTRDTWWADSMVVVKAVK